MNLVKYLFVAFPLSLSGMALASQPIFIEPGQCIVVGNQQVCARADSAMKNESNKVTYVCRFGLHADAETPEVKTFALLQVQVTPRGKKVETSVKNFGLNGKDACEKEADSKNKA